MKNLQYSNCQCCTNNVSVIGMIFLLLISYHMPIQSDKGAVAHGVSRSINFSQYFFFLLHCVPLYVCRLCINFQELCARLLGMATLRISFSPSFHALLIDFLSIRKVIIFSAIAIDDRHPLRSRSIHQNAANCMTIRFRYIAQPRGVRKTYCARSRK